MNVGKYPTIRKDEIEYAGNSSIEHDVIGVPHARGNVSCVVGQLVAVVSERAHVVVIFWKPVDVHVKIVVRAASKMFKTVVSHTSVVKITHVNYAHSVSHIDVIPTVWSVVLVVYQNVVAKITADISLNRSVVMPSYQNHQERFRGE